MTGRESQVAIYLCINIGSAIITFLPVFVFSLNMLKSTFYYMIND